MCLDYDEISRAREGMNVDGLISIAYFVLVDIADMLPKIVPLDFVKID